MKYKLKVEREFIDKNTQKLRKAGSTFTADEARGKELLAHPQGLVSVVEEIDEGDKPVKMTAKELDEVEIVRFNADGTVVAMIDGEEKLVKPANKAAADAVEELKAAAENAGEDETEPAAADETSDNK